MFLIRELKVCLKIIEIEKGGVKIEHTTRRKKGKERKAN